MRSFSLKLGGRDEGPFSDSEIAQMFADGRVNRDTPCRLPEEQRWRTIDDYFPTLKYGTQLPPPTPPVATLATSNVGAPKVSIVDLDVPFGSLLKLMFKWVAAGMIVAICILPIVFVVWLIVIAILAAIFGQAIHALPHK